MQRLNIYMVVIALLMLLTSCGTTDTLIADVDALINERGAIQEKNVKNIRVYRKNVVPLSAEWER